MSDSALPRPPEMLEGFRVGPLRRSAGALAIHAATDRLELPVELHMVRIAAMPGGAAAFLDTLRRATEVRHESFLPYVTGGKTDELLFAAAKTVDAAALDEVIARGGGLDEERVLAIGIQIASVLAALDRAGLRHGDLTPRRILLPGRGQVAVMPPRLVPATAAPRNDRYQSPEEARGGPGDARSDLFVLGLLLTEALNGHPVLKAPTTEARRLLAEGRVAADLSRARPATRPVLARLLAPDPADRYPNAAAAEAALRAAAAGIEEAPLVAAAPVPVAIPADRGGGSPAPVPASDRAETAPVPRAVVAQALAQAGAQAGLPAAAAAQANVPQAPASADAAVPAEIRRSPGRLYVQGRLGETLLEIDESVHVGRPAGGIDVVARPDPFPEAEFAVDRTETSDVLRVLRGPVTVNGAASETHVLRQGDQIAGTAVRGRYEASVRTALRATGYTGGPPQSTKAARLMKLSALVIALAGIGIALPRLTSARQAADDADARAAAAKSALDTAKRAGGGTATAPGTPSASTPATLREQAARDAYQSAKEWQRKNSADTAGGIAKLREVAERYGETGHGAVARAEVADSERRIRTGGGGAGGGDFDRVLADARKLADEGRLDDAMKSLRDFAESRMSTVAGERAAAAITQIENEVLGRFEADAARAERAIAQKDWTGALRIASTIMDYAPASLRDRVREIVRRAEQGREGVAGGGPKPPGPTPPGPTTPPGPNPPPGPDAPPGPGAGEPPPDPADRDREAETAFRAARKLMEANKDAEAIDAFLTFLRDYKDTKPGAKYDGEVRSRISALSEGPAGVQKLFRGRCEKLEKKGWRVTYDFSDAEQLKDFRDVEAFESPPRAEWKVVEGAVHAKGSGAFVLDATFLIDQLVANVVIVPERAHDLGVAFVDASEPRRFYLYILQNTFFTLGRGDAAKVFEENAIVLFGPAMWRDTPPGQIGFVRKCGSAEPTVRPSEATPLKCGKSENQVWMRMEGGKQISGGAYGDVKLDFKGIEPAFFVLNSGGSFDDLVIEGTPDPEWVRSRWRAILSGL